MAFPIGMINGGSVPSDKLKTITINREIASMGTYFICRFIGLKDVYLNVAPPLSGVPDT
jgi:hypothetical protein